MLGSMSDQAAARALRDALRAGLTAALKTRDADARDALRTAIAAVDNAEAVAAPDGLPPASSARIAGAVSGLGAAEAPRRRLSAADLREILRAQVAEQTQEAERYEALGQPDAARRLRARARTLTAYLAEG